MDKLAKQWGMMSLADAADYVGIDADTLAEWVGSRHAPHYTVDGHGPLFKKSELKAWVKDNLIQHCEGEPVHPLPVLVQVARAAIDGCIPPLAIGAVNNLCVVPMGPTVSGVYFLCDGDEVVYVGQSNCVVFRVATHVKEAVKVFDRVFFLPAPLSSLNDIETEYIRTLKPKYNRQSWGSANGALSNWRGSCTRRLRAAGIEGWEGSHLTMEEIADRYGVELLPRPDSC